MTSAPIILALDAATYMGWALGRAGENPISGSQFWAKSGAGASRGAVFGGAMRFIAQKIDEHGTDLHIVIEEPLPTSHVAGRTTTNVTKILMGLPAAIEGMAFIMGCFNVNTARVDSIRKHFIGKNMKAELAKPLVMRKCIALGWVNYDDDDMSHDRSDALACWSYAEHKLAPRICQPIDDLFVKSEAKKRGLTL